MKTFSFWQQFWNQFKKHTLGYTALWVVFAFAIVAIYAPFLASSKPLFVVYDGTPYFPLFSYLFYPKFFSKNLDIFYNLLIFILPLGLLASHWFKYRFVIPTMAALQIGLFASLLMFPVSNPAKGLPQSSFSPQAHTWQNELSQLSLYGKLNLLLEYQREKAIGLSVESTLAKHQQSPLSPLLKLIPTLWHMNYQRDLQKLQKKEVLLQQTEGLAPSTHAQDELEAIAYIEERNQWLEENSLKLRFELSPLLSSYHWEDDAAGSAQLNQYLPWWQMSRINQKSLLAALIFGTRISLVVGILAVAIALSIAVPIGAMAGYYGGKIDIIICRVLEVWESMPTFFMLLLIIAVTQSKSIFLVISVIGLFGWTGFSRFLRGEFLKQRNLPYVEACHALGYSTPYIIFTHILPNSIPPLLTLLPFAIMGAIGSESGLSFLGLGEEGSCSWGVLMDEGRSSFPAQSSLLWPPAFLLTVLLVSIALVGDALRDTLDPKLHR